MSVKNSETGCHCVQTARTVFASDWIFLLWNAQDNPFGGSKDARDSIGLSTVKVGDAELSNSVHFNYLGVMQSCDGKASYPLRKASRE